MLSTEDYKTTKALFRVSVGAGKVAHLSEDMTETLCYRKCSERSTAGAVCARCHKVAMRMVESAAELAAEIALYPTHEEKYKRFVYDDNKIIRAGIDELALLSARDVADKEAEPRSERWFEVAYDAYFPDTPSGGAMMLPHNKKEETMPPAKKTAPPAAKFSDGDVDSMISNVHSAIDRIKEAVAMDEGDERTDILTKVPAEAEDIIRQLPTAKRTALRAAVKEAVKLADKPAEEPKPAPIVRVADDFREIDGINALVDMGAKRAREGVEYGIKMGSTSEAVASVILDMRTKIANPKTGLPDLLAEGKVPKNAAGAIYKEAKKDVDALDVQTLSAHNSLEKSVQNRMSDVLVAFLRKFDEKDVSALGKLFPDAEKAVRESREAIAKAKEEGTEEADLPSELTPTEAIYQLYASKGTELPRKGRTELARDKARAKKALEAGGTSAAADTSDDGKTRQERAFERLTKADELVGAATKDASKLTDDEKADLKARLNALVAKLAAQAAAL